MEKLLEKLKQQRKVLQTKRKIQIDKINETKAKIQEIREHALNNKETTLQRIKDKIKSSINKITPYLNNYYELTKHRELIEKISKHKISSEYVRENIKGYILIIILLTFTLIFYFWCLIHIILNILNTVPLIHIILKVPVADWIIIPRKIGQEIAGWLALATLWGLLFNITLAVSIVMRLIPDEEGYRSAYGFATKLFLLMVFSLVLINSLVLSFVHSATLVDMRGIVAYRFVRGIVAYWLLSFLVFIVISLLFAVRNLVFFMRLRSLPDIVFEPDVAYSVLRDESLINYLRSMVSGSVRLDVDGVCSKIVSTGEGLDRVIPVLTDIRMYCKNYLTLMRENDVNKILEYIDEDRLKLLDKYEKLLERLEKELGKIEISCKFVEGLIRAVEADVGSNYVEANISYKAVINMLKDRDVVASIRVCDYVSPDNIGGVENAMSALNGVFEVNKALLVGDPLKIHERFRRLSDLSEKLMSSSRENNVYLDLVLGKLAQVRKIHGEILNLAIAPTASRGELVFIGKALRLRFKGVEVKPIKERFRVAGVEVRGVIGVGGFAATLLGVDEVGRSFVVKVPREVLESLVTGVTYRVSKNVIRVFRKELDVLKSLNHPHIVEVVDGGVSSGIPFIMIEFCENGSLRGVLESQGKLSLRDALLIGIQVADVLSYIHSMNIVHRDLKPENILFTREGILKVTDFNIVKVMGTVSPTTSRLSPYTPGYAAPEQIYNNLGKIGPWTDIWALGIILHEMVTGRTPFDRWNYQESIKEPPTLEDLPPNLSKLIQKMLSKNPAERPTAKEVRNALLNIMTSQR